MKIIATVLFIIYAFFGYIMLTLYSQSLATNDYLREGEILAIVPISVIILETVLVIGTCKLFNKETKITKHLYAIITVATIIMCISNVSIVSSDLGTTILLTVAIHVTLVVCVVCLKMKPKEKFS